MTETISYEYTNDDFEIFEQDGNVDLDFVYLGYHYTVNSGVLMNNSNAYFHQLVEQFIRNAAYGPIVLEDANICDVENIEPNADECRNPMSLHLNAECELVTWNPTTQAILHAEITKLNDQELLNCSRAFMLIIAYVCTGVVRMHIIWNDKDGYNWDVFFETLQLAQYCEMTKLHENMARFVYDKLTSLHAFQIINMATKHGQALLRERCMAHLEQNVYEPNWHKCFTLLEFEPMLSFITRKTFQMRFMKLKDCLTAWDAQHPGYDILQIWLYARNSNKNMQLVERVKFGKLSVVQIHDLMHAPCTKSPKLPKTVASNC